MADAFDWLGSMASAASSLEPAPVVVSIRTVLSALEDRLMVFTRKELDVVLRDELELTGPNGLAFSEMPPGSKREAVDWVTEGWTLEALIELARRVSHEYGQAGQLDALVAKYDDRNGGVPGEVKNLIFAANGPKPELVLTDALNNHIKIVRNEQYCLVYDRPLPSNGLTYAELVAWWRERDATLSELSEAEVGRHLYARLAASLASLPERVLFDAYNRRYGTLGFDIPALLPQVYLHYDPYSIASRLKRGEPAAALARQRMDFLMLFSSRKRVVLEVDGKQHYSDEAGRADPSLYAHMVREDRRLRSAGYQVYRFGAVELLDKAEAEAVLDDFFNELTS